MVIRRIEITFNEKEQDLLDYLDGQNTRSATLFKHLLREKMNESPSIIDYEKIKEIVQGAISTNKVIPLQSSNRQLNNDNKLLLNFAKKR